MFGGLFRELALIKAMATENFAPQLGRRPSSARIPFGAALRQHARVISALLQREAVQRGRNPLQSVFALVEPLFLIAVISSAHYLFMRGVAPYGSSDLLFLSTGFIPHYFFTYVARRMRRSVESSKNRLAAESALDYMFVHAILRCIDYTILSILLFAVLYAFVTPQALPTNLTPILEAFAAMALFGLGVGILSLAIGRVFPYWRFILPALTRGLMLFSGIHFVPDFLSPGARHILSFNPVFHAITLFRLGFYPQYPHMALDREYLALSVLVTIFLGLVAERVIRRHMD